MMCKKKACPAGSTAGQAGGGKRYYALSHAQHTTKTEQAQAWKISGLLSSGRENAVPLHRLEEITGLDGRSLRVLIQRERLQGAPILADNQNGYYLPANDNEKAAFVRSMRHRAKEIQRAAEAVERGMEFERHGKRNAGCGEK